MIAARSIGSLVAMFMMVVATLNKDAWYADGLRYLALTYFAVSFIIQIWQGYRRRRPHLTVESWRRYLLVCTIPIGAIAILVALLFALEMKLPIMGESRSTLRAFWVMGTLFFVMVAGVGSSMVVGWLTDGEATKQFELPRWLSRRRHTAT